MRRVALFWIAAVCLVGCRGGDTPPMTTEQLSQDQIAKDNAPPPAEGSFNRPQGNPNAPYQPRR
ncbi:MAG: hypothetical protein AMXMBFR81_21190 [Chthonomonas sp.]